MSEIRSVSVHLEADVASYIAKMRLAGAETDKAFSHAGSSIDGVNTRLSTTDTELQKVEGSANRVESSVRRLDGTVRRSGGGWEGYTKKVGGFVDKLVVLPGLALGAVAALQPLAVAGAAVAAAFAPPIAFAGGGLGLFAILGGFAISETNKELKTIDSAQKKLDGLTKGTKAYADQQKVLAQAQRALSGPQKEYSDSLDHLHQSFDKFITGKSGDELLGPISAALDLGANLLPKIEPIIGAVSGGLETLLGDLDRFSQTNEFSRFVHDVADQIGPDLVIGGRALGHFTEGIGNLLVTAGKTPAARGLLRELGHLGDSFAGWSSSKQGRDEVQSFFRYFHQIGPDVAHTIGSVADAVAQVSHALAPIGPVELRVISGIATAISNIPIPVLTALAGGATGLALFSKLGGFKAVGAAPTALSAGRNVLSAVTGGLVSPSKYGRGVQAVYVTNPGFGSGSGGGPGGAVGKTAGFLEKHPFVAGTVGVTGTAAVIALTAFAAYKVWKAESSSVTVSAGNRSTDYWQKFNQDRLAQQFDTRTAPQVKAVGTALDSVNQKLSKASQNLELVGHSADRAIPNAAKDVEQLGAKVNGINGGKASAALDLVGHSASRNSATAGNAVDNLKHKLDGIPANKSVKINADTGQAQSQIQSVKSALAGIDRVVNVHVNVTRNTNALLADVNTPKPHAGGGYITGPGGPTSDSIPARLSNGEFVMRAAAVRHYGLGAMYSMNAAGYASGGLVSQTHSSSNHGATNGAQNELHHFQQALADSTKTLDQERQQRQNLVQQRQQLSSTVTGNFRSDLFGTQSLWGQASDPLAILRGDIRSGRRYDRTIGRLGRRGLSGGVLGQITTLASAQQVAGMSDAQLRQLEHLFAVRQRVSRNAGADLGDMRYGEQITRATKAQEATAAEVRAINLRIKETNHKLDEVRKAAAQDGPKAVADGINHAAGTAARRVRKG